MSLKDCRIVVRKPENVKTAFFLLEGKKEKCIEGSLRGVDKNSAVTRIRTWVTAATTQGPNHKTITATNPDRTFVSMYKWLQVGNLIPC